MIETLRNEQTPDGSWAFPFETGITTDCYMIILLRTLEIHDEELIQELVERISSKQEKNGAWKLFYDEGEGNVTATIEAYYSLLYSGYFSKNNKRMKEAKQFILKNGGLTSAHMFTKTMLALTGQIRWPLFFPFPVEFILLPTYFPIHFFSLSVYGRSNLAPLLILADKRFVLRTEKSPDITDLIVQRTDDDFDGRSKSSEWRSLQSFIRQGVNSLLGVSEKIHQLAIDRTLQYMLKHIEEDGTFYNYFSSTFLMILALLSLGYSKTDPLITKAINGLKAMKTNISGSIHMQYTTANVWNTSLLSYALQEAGVHPNDSMVEKANQYLLSKQHKKLGDWALDTPKTLPGGWGFSDINSMNPDVDDTTASLRSIARCVPTNPKLRLAWEKGLLWLLSMQNNDGGWPAFERNKDNWLLRILPLEKGEFMFIDPSCTDLTGRTLEFLCGYTKLAKESPFIKKAGQWIFDHQEKNGSWYGRWGICYIYGTWSALTGLKALEISSDHRAIQSAVKWLQKIQNQDGGWGESCKSDSKQTYVPLGTSTITHTSWALDALISASSQPTLTIQKGLHYLLHTLQSEDDWTNSYPTGQGMAGDFYIHYHSYQYIFPLLTLSHYLKKYH